MPTKAKKSMAIYTKYTTEDRVNLYSVTAKDKRHIIIIYRSYSNNFWKTNVITGVIFRFF